MTTAGMRPRILIVDDEAANMEALCLTLRQHDFDTSGRLSAGAALAALASERYELLLTDLNMPGLDGLALVQAARAIDGELACIVMTGAGSIASAVGAMKMGALDYIVKPCRVSSIVPVLARALETRALRIANARLEQQLRQHAAELRTLNQALERSREQAEQASREKSAFLSNMSHELRTSLNAINGFAQILCSDRLPSTSQEKRQFSRHILESGKHLLALINEVLDLSKVEAGHIQLAPSQFTLSALLAECRSTMLAQAEARAVTLAFPAPATLSLQADRTRLKQVLINLLSNAVKYNREGGQVELSWTVLPAGQLHIAVSDTGCGLTPEQQRALFQPFNRLGQEQSAAEGSGLGLALSKRLIEAMHGSLGCDSQAAGGSTFWIELPLDAAPEPAAPAARGTAASGSLP